MCPQRGVETIANGHVALPGVSDPGNDSAQMITICNAGGSGENRTYRGTITQVWGDGALRTVNTVSVEQYLRSVVPRESPASWHQEALRSQAVAARSYALAERRWTWADTCSSDSCQVYYGFAGNAGVFTSFEDPRTDAAIVATRGVVRRMTSTGSIARCRVLLVDGRMVGRRHVPRGRRRRRRNAGQCPAPLDDEPGSRHARRSVRHRHGAPAGRHAAQRPGRPRWQGAQGERGGHVGSREPQWGRVPTRGRPVLGLVRRRRSPAIPRLVLPIRQRARRAGGDRHLWSSRLPAAERGLGRRRARQPRGVRRRRVVPPQRQQRRLPPCLVLVREPRRSAGRRPMGRRRRCGRHRGVLARNVLPAHVGLSWPTRPRDPVRLRWCHPRRR